MLKMKTIEKILAKYGVDASTLKTDKNCNWCWWKWGIDFDNLMEALPYFRQDKGQKLMQDLRLVCCLHDLCFTRWWNWKDFLKCNWQFAKNVYQLINWTKWIYRIIIFIVLFLWTTLFGKKYFNWWSKK